MCPDCKDLLTSVSHALQNRPSLRHDASIQWLTGKRSEHFGEGEDIPTKPNEKLPSWGFHACIHQWPSCFIQRGKQDHWQSCETIESGQENEATQCAACYLYECFKHDIYIWCTGTLNIFMCMKSSNWSVLNMSFISFVKSSLWLIC